MYLYNHPNGQSQKATGNIAGVHFRDDALGDNVAENYPYGVQKTRCYLGKKDPVPSETGHSNSG